MSEIHGTYFDGVGSTSYAATLTTDFQTVLLESDSATLQISLAEITIDARLGSTPRRITWGDRASFVTPDNDAIDGLAAHLPGGVSLGWVNWLEQRLAIALVSLVLVISCGFSFAIWGVPAIAEYVAYAVPDEVSDRLGQTTLSNIGELLDGTELPQARQDYLRSYFQRYGRVNRIVFKKSKLLGANAFALSCTTLTFTDDLVALTDDDEELLGVYLHELGHAQLRHVERTILQGSAWIVLLTVLTGDLSGVGELILTLPLVIGQTAYSREFERAADEFAVNAMIEANVSPLKLASILAKLERSHRERGANDGKDESSANAETEDTSDADTQDATADASDDESHTRTTSQVAQILFDYLSTHPATSDRIAYIESRAAQM